MSSITVNGNTVLCTDIDVRGQCVAAVMLPSDFWGVFGGWIGDRTAVIANTRVFERCTCTAEYTKDMKHVNVFFTGKEVFYNERY